MTKEEQLKFTTELVSSIHTDIQTHILNGDVPDTWDGFELRQWLANKFNHSTRPMGKQRRAKFNNYILIHNL